MAGFDISDGIYKAFLAGVGAAASGAEKGQQVIDDFVKKGQITVEQGKNLNSELTRKVKETFDATVSGASDSVLRSKLESMTPEQRAEYAKKVADMSAAIDAEGAGAAEDAVVEDTPDAAEDVVEPDVAE